MVSPVIIAAAGGLGWAYAALALATLPVAAWLLMISSPIVAAPASVGEVSGETGRVAVVGAFVLLAAFCQGAEAGFGGWIYVIAMEAGFADGHAARLLSGFWVVFTIGRVLSIVVATRIRPKSMLLGDLLGSLLSVAVLLLVPGPVGLWVGTLGLGLSLASVFPTLLALAGQYVELTGAVTSRLFVGGSLGTMVMPWVLGGSFGLGGLGHHGPMLIVLLDLVIAGAVFVAIVTRVRPSTC
jgi:FHS family Na+ dependent glucose MFS transporter 1